MIAVLVEFGQPQVSPPTTGEMDNVVAFVIADETLVAQLVPLYGLAVAYCEPASTAWLTRICCEKARPRSMTGVNMARKTGAASPNSTADMPRRSRAGAPSQARQGRTNAATLPNGEELRKDKVQS